MTLWTRSRQLQFKLLSSFTFNFVFKIKWQAVKQVVQAGFIVTNWNKTGKIYCKLGKGDSLFAAYLYWKKQSYFQK